MSAEQRRRTGGPNIRLVQVLFLATFLIAAAGAVLSGPRLLAGAGWAVLCMAAYGLVVWLVARPVARTDAFADSFYYLGFLLTLVALVGVLLNLGTVQGDELLASVLRQFGLALITTVFGLLVRITLVNFGEDADDLEVSSREQAERAYESLVRSLDRMAVEADSFSRSFRSRLESAMAPIEPAMQRYADGATAIADRLDPVQRQLGSLTETLEQTSGKVSQSGDELSRSVGGVAATLGSTTASFSQAAASLDTMLQRLQQLGDRGQDPFTLLARRGQEMQGGIAELRTALQGMAQLVEQRGLLLESHLAGWEDNLQRFGRLHDRLKQDAEQANRATEEVRDEVAAGVRALVDQLRNGDRTPHAR